VVDWRILPPWFVPLSLRSFHEYPHLVFAGRDVSVLGAGD
jgi:hypothetical protein